MAGIVKVSFHPRKGFAFTVENILDFNNKKTTLWDILSKMLYKVVLTSNGVVEGTRTLDLLGHNQAL